MKRSIRWRFAAVALVAVFTLAAGCNNSSLDSSVSGTVTLDGKPLELGGGTGTISFFPEAGGPAALATIAPNGSYVLKTGDTQGLRSGSYVVTVVATGPRPKPKPGDSPLPGPLLTPTQYGTRQRSDLRFTIVPGPNQIDVPLTSR